MLGLDKPNTCLHSEIGEEWFIYNFSSGPRRDTPLTCFEKIPKARPPTESMRRVQAGLEAIAKDVSDLLGTSFYKCIKHNHDTCNRCPRGDWYAAVHTTNACLYVKKK